MCLVFTILITWYNRKFICSRKVYKRWDLHDKYNLHWSFKLAIVNISAIHKDQIKKDRSYNCVSITGLLIKKFLGVLTKDHWWIRLLHIFWWFFFFNLFICTYIEQTKMYYLAFQSLKCKGSYMWIPKLRLRCLYSAWMREGRFKRWPHKCTKQTCKCLKLARRKAGL